MLLLELAGVKITAIIWHDIHIAVGGIHAILVVVHGLLGMNMRLNVAVHSGRVGAHHGLMMSLH
jgi:hypothetical protein